MPSHAIETRIALEKEGERCPTPLSWFDPRGIRYRRLYQVPSSECAHHTHVVADWLRSVNKAEYISNFHDNDVTARNVLSLNTAELKYIGVKSLADRRAILQEVGRLANEPVPEFLHNFTTEHGRILTHLSNDRLLLIWLRVAVVMLIAAVGTYSIGYRFETPDENQPTVQLTSVLLVCLAVLVTIYAAYQFYYLMDMADRPLRYPKGHRLRYLFPSFLLVICGIGTCYALMAHNESKVAFMLLLFV